MPPRHFAPFLSGHWVQGSPHAPGAMPPIAQVIRFHARCALRAQQIAQHERQNPAVAHVFDFFGCVHAQRYVELFRFAV
jgi:hypothetical protein